MSLANGILYLLDSYPSRPGTSKRAIDSARTEYVNNGNISISMVEGITGDGTEAQMHLQMSPYGVEESKTGSGSNVHFM